jgi:hypothetical protein
VTGRDDVLHRERVQEPAGSAAGVSAKRPLKSRLIELGLWALVSIVTAVVMILLSNKLLPANF